LLCSSGNLALNENIGRWETTWFTFIYYI